MNKFGYVITKDGKKYEGGIEVAGELSNVHIRAIVDHIANEMVNKAQKVYNGRNDEDEILERSEKLLEDME